MKLTLEDRIRERAYFVSQSGGGAGDGSHFWLIAERELLAAMESALASPLAEAIESVETENQTAVLEATETAQQPATELKETARKPRAAAKGSTKSAKAASPAAAAESPAAKSAITPTKSATKTRARAAAR